LGGAVGIAPEICQRADKIIIEINTRLPDFRGMHDIIRCQKPPHRRPYLISRVDDRIGETEIMDFDRDQVVAIIESDKKDNGSAMSPLDDQSKRISDHLMNFFEENVRKGTLPPNLYPIQSGVGNIANAVVSKQFPNFIRFQDSKIQIFN
jgi:acetyl-CoA hydrolase